MRKAADVFGGKAHVPTLLSFARCLPEESDYLHQRQSESEFNSLFTQYLHDVGYLAERKVRMEGLCCRATSERRCQSNAGNDTDENSNKVLLLSNTSCGGRDLVGWQPYFHV